MLATLLVLFLGACARPPTVTDEPGRTITVKVTNQRAEPVYVVSDGCSGDPLTVRDPGGDVVRTSSGQSFGCARVVEDRPCPSVGGCMDRQLERIEPGATLEATWDGRRVEGRHVEAVGQGCPSDCVVRVRVPDGSYEIAVEAIACKDGECACEGEEGEECEVPEAFYERQPDLNAQATAAVAGDVTVELAFGP